MVNSERYEVIRRIGRGAMGEVFLAEDRILKRKVALKFLILPEGLDLVEKSEAEARFYREAQAAARLNHPNIVVVHDIDEIDGRPYISMEYLEGETLDRVLSRGPLSAEVAVEIIFQILEALDYAHEKGVIHRDIKPDNIFLTRKGSVKITDFGIARIVDSPITTQTRLVVGTPGYMSPEQVKGEPVDRRTDIFSCGVLLFELLTGHKAFSGPSLTAIIYKVVNENLPPLRELDPSLPPHLDAVIVKATAKDPEERYPTAAHMAEALRAGAVPAPEAYKAGGALSRESTFRGTFHPLETPLDTKDAPNAVPVTAGTPSDAEMPFAHYQILEYRSARKRRRLFLAGLLMGGLAICGIFIWLLLFVWGLKGVSEERKVVTQAYHDLLAREPSDEELAYYEKLLREGWIPERVREAVMETDEYKQRQVILAYRDLLGRDPEPIGLRHFTELMKGGWTIEQVREAIKTTDEYKTRLITQAYRDLLDRDPDPEGLRHYLELMKGGWTIEQVRETIKTTDEYKMVLVTQAYRELLGRDPDPIGLRHFAELMKGGWTIEQVRESLKNSEEYQDKHGE